jgi:hypothetical protein
MYEKDMRVPAGGRLVYRKLQHMNAGVTRATTHHPSKNRWPRRRARPIEHQSIAASTVPALLSSSPWGFFCLEVGGGDEGEGEREQS